MSELGLKEFVLIHGALNFCVRASATKKQGQASTNELVRVRQLVERVINGLSREDAVEQPVERATIFHKPS